MDQYAEMYGSVPPQMRRIRDFQEYRQNDDGSSSMPNFNAPPQETFDTEEMRGSMQSILARNIGQYVLVEFLIGTAEIVRKQGVLYHVGRSFITLYDDTSKNFIVCDVFSIKFVYFYFPGERPRTNFNQFPSSSASGPNGRR